MNIIFGLIGGLGLFIYGLKITGKVLQQAASFRSRNIIEKLTKNVFLSTILGILVTSLIQSSSATTVLLVSFINAGLITLSGSIGMIFGANIGTTLTVQIISFNVEQYTLPAIGIGVFLSTFSQHIKIKNTGKILLGFGIIFLGLSIMKDSVEPLHSSGLFKEFITRIGTKNFSSLLLGLLISTIATAIVQASGATLGVVIAFAATGLITDLHTAIPLILGSKIGTCITAFLASINSNRDSKRVAVAHFTFNIIGTMLTLAFLDPFVSFINYISHDISRQIANAHTAISVLTTIVCIPFTRHFVLLIEKIIPIKKTEENRLNYFDLNLLESPSIAISSTKKALIKMGRYSRGLVKVCLDGFINNKLDNIRGVHRLEQLVDDFQHNISLYIMEISKCELSGYEAAKINSYREVANDFERISDHVENIADNIMYARHAKCKPRKKHIESLNSIRSYIAGQFDKVLQALEDSDQELAKDTLQDKQHEKQMYKDHTINLNEQIRTNKLEPELGMLLIDIIYNMQRISYHLRRTLYSIIYIRKTKSYTITDNSN